MHAGSTAWAGQSGPEASQQNTRQGGEEDEMSGLIEVFMFCYRQDVD